MDNSLHQLIAALHDAPYRCVLALAGGGTGAAAALLAVPGGSRTILEIVVPYHEAALTEFLGARPEQFCSAETSRDMARRAWERAHWLAPGHAAVGVGCTASLATDRPKRGDHRVHIGLRTNEGTRTRSLTLAKGARDREQEEAVLDAVLLNALAEAFGVSERLPVPLLPGEEVQAEAALAANRLAALSRGDLAAVCVETDGRVRPDAERPAALIPGAFNPLHQAHRELAEVASRTVGGRAAFELSVLNVDKPPLTEDEVRRRVAQFAWLAPVWLTRAPTFAEKTELFPGTTFAIGADTAARIVSPKYYQGDEARMGRALDGIRGRGCKFLVAGRADPAGAFVELGQLPVPPAHADLFTAIPADSFRVDVSSTRLREQST